MIELICKKLTQLFSELLHSLLFLKPGLGLFGASSELALFGAIAVVQALFGARAKLALFGASSELALFGAIAEAVQALFGASAELALYGAHCRI